MSIVSATAHYVAVTDLQSVALNDVPVLPYHTFYQAASALLQQARHRCILYTAFRANDEFHFVANIVDDATCHVKLLRNNTAGNTPLRSLGQTFSDVLPFERAIAQRFGIRFRGTPKPHAKYFNSIDEKTIV